MTQSEIYMDNDDLKLYIDVQPVYIDALENSKNSAAASAQSAQQSAQNAQTWLNNIISYKTNLELFYAQASNNLANLLNSYTAALTETKESALNAVLALKDTVLGNISSTLQSALNTLQATGQNIINQARSYAEQAQSTVDNRVSTDHLNQSKALQTGAISTDTEVFHDIVQYTHSTYCGDQASDASPLDPKKFIKAGSPTITSDGVASGLSGSNYLTKTLNNITLNNLEIYGTFKSPASYTKNQEIITSLKDNTGSGTDYTLLNISINVANNRIGCSCHDDTTWKGFYTANNSIALNTQYYYHFYCKDGYINLDLSTDGTTYSNVIKEAITVSDNYIANIIKFGSTGDTVNYFEGSIDLKGVNIIVDRVPVFSGNKTGVDTIKADDFSAPSGGSLPTISDNGIASGFSASNYINSGFDFKPNGRPWTCYCQFTIGNDDLTTQQGIIAPYGAGDSLTINLVGGKINIFLSSNGTSWDIASNWKLRDEAVQIGKTYYIAVEWTGTQYKLKSFENGVWTTVDTMDSTTPIYDNSQLYYIGTNRGAYNSTSQGQYFRGSIDLNALRFYIDGNLVYQPCLKIPFTESKTGSKIVNSIYRDRVNDMAEQFGYANYYTLDRNAGNFTLPMGELYGMIEKLRTLILASAS